MANSSRPGADRRDAATANRDDAADRCDKFSDHRDDAAEQRDAQAARRDEHARQVTEDLEGRLSEIRRVRLPWCHYAAA